MEGQNREILANAMLNALEKQLDMTKKKIIQRSMSLAEKEGEDQEITVTILSNAIREVFTLFSSGNHKKSALETITNYISPLTMILASLTIVFGFLGLQSVGDPKGFLDIAKIFAGAIAGSAAATEATRQKSKRA
jgi:hypothetical protein